MCKALPSVFMRRQWLGHLQISPVPGRASVYIQSALAARLANHKSLAYSLANI